MSGYVRRLNGKVVTREELCDQAFTDWSELRFMASNTYGEHKPLVSDGVGCMKSQVPELRKTIKRHSIQGAQVTDDGQVRFTSRRARRELLRVRGLVDNDGCYGDG